MSLGDLKPAEVFSVLASVGSLVATGYFWLVRSNKERPRLRTHLVGVEVVQPARSFESGWDPLVILRVAVTNLSTLPNVVLGVRGWVEQRGGTWAPAVARFVNGTTAFNVAPQMAEFRNLSLELPRVPNADLPKEEADKLSWREGLEAALGGPMTFKIELLSLDEKTFTDIIRVPPAG